MISFVKLHKISPSVGAPELIRSYRGIPYKITLNKCILSFSRADCNANICPGIFMPIFPYIYLGGMCNV